MTKAGTGSRRFQVRRGGEDRHPPAFIFEGRDPPRDRGATRALAEEASGRGRHGCGECGGQAGKQAGGGGASMEPVRRGTALPISTFEALSLRGIGRGGQTKERCTGTLSPRRFGPLSSGLSFLRQTFGVQEHRPVRWSSEARIYSANSLRRRLVCPGAASVGITGIRPTRCEDACVKLISCSGRREKIEFGQ